MSRNTWKFHGGIHPPQNKQQSVSASIRQLPLPDKLILPLQQHIGAPGKVLVSVGDRVLKGQLLAQAKGFVSANLHAPSSGTVIDISDQPVQHPSGLPGKCIVIETDGKEQWCEIHPIDDYRQMDATQLLATINNAGIVGMGGAGFPSHVKIGTQQTISTLILNAVECEPYITSDDLLMRERAAEIIEGLQILAFILNPKEILVGIEDNKPEAIAAMRRAAQESTEANPGAPCAVTIVSVPTIYPSGGEKQIIQILTGKEVPSGGLPSDLGIVCHNTGTVHAIRNAVIEGKPLISRITTMTGNLVTDPGNIEVLLGTPVSHLLQHTRTSANQIHRLIMGGPMMGFSMRSTEIPIVKTSNCIIAADDQEFPDAPPEQPCIRCGACAEVCPAKLLPQQLFFYSKSKEIDKAKHYNLMDCIECGACSFVCPSQIPLVQYFRFGKGEVRKSKIETDKSDRARMRFEAHQERLEKEAAAKEEKRQQRAAANALKKEKQAKAKLEKEAAEAANPSTAASTAQESSNEPSNNDADEALETLKSNATKASKRYQQAKKALQMAEKNGADNIDKLREKILQLETKASDAKKALKEALPSPAKKIPAKSDATPNNTPKETDTSAVIAAATARVKVKKAQNALMAAEASDASQEVLEHLSTNLNTARTELEQHAPSEPTTGEAQ
ncbi:MAG: electron transport complex subunit RsxC [Moraxellaceae bacterium]|nr:MAG: electron transport complex subunit RsxC [Moraxellaceae bacterium]